MGIPLTAVFRRNEQGSGFTGIVAEMPGPYAHGETLAETLADLRRSLVSFFNYNRKLALNGLNDNAVVEIVVLEATSAREQPPRLDASAAPVIAVNQLLRIPLPIRVRFGDDDQLVRHLIDSSVIVGVTLDTVKLAQLVHALADPKNTGA